MIDGFMSRPGLLSRTTPTNPPAIARLHTWNDADLLLGGGARTGAANTGQRSLRAFEPGSGFEAVLSGYAASVGVAG